MSAESRLRRLKACESVATFGLLLLAIGLVAPFTSLDNDTLIEVFKWIFAAGALMYTAARVVGGYAPDDSPRVRRLRRMEVWAGIAFCVAAGFWFYNGARFSMMSLYVMRDTVVFTLVGALIQIISSWMVIYVRRKQDKGTKTPKK